MARCNGGSKAGCIHELEGQSARIEKAAKKKAKGGKAKWVPESITKMATCQKGRLRPLPMHVEAQVLYFAASYRGNERETEESVGAALKKSMIDPCGDTCCEENTVLPLPYCRVCDLAYDSVDTYYKHIQSEQHAAMKENGSVPLFEAVVGDEALTMNQVIAREFMGPALALMKKKDEETNTTEEEESEETTEEDEESDMEEEDGTEESVDSDSENDDDAKSLNEESLTIDKNSLDPKEIVELRLKHHPCAECARIWEEYGSLICTTTEDMTIEFAYRSHPIHPCVALLNMTLECFKANLTIDSDEAKDPSSTRPVKYPSREQLKELVQDLEKKITVYLELGDRHTYACAETYQVALHCRAEEVKVIYDRFMDGCKKRDQEGRLFYCDICRVMLPSSRHFRLHLLSEGHDKKMGKAPIRQSALYNPLCQMVCFLDATSLLMRKKLKKIEKKEERKEERRKERAKKENEKEDQKVKTAEVRKEKKEVKGEEKNVEKKKRTEKRERKPLVVRYELETKPGFTKDHRGFLFYRMGPPAADEQKKVIEVIRRERTESEKEQDKIVYKVSGGFIYRTSRDTSFIEHNTVSNML